MGKKVVTRENVADWRKSGKSVKEMLNLVNEGVSKEKKVSQDTFSKQCKAWGINLRGKVKEVGVIFAAEVPQIAEQPVQQTEEEVITAE